MNYSEKADDIWDAIWEARNNKFEFPLLSEMIERKRKEKEEYYRIINRNLFLYGSSPISFEILEDKLTEK